METTDWLFVAGGVLATAAIEWWFFVAGCMVAALAAMVPSMPLMRSTGDEHHGPAGGTGDALLRWTHDVLDPWLAARLPFVYGIDPFWLRLVLLCLTTCAMGWAGRGVFARAWASFRRNQATFGREARPRYGQPPMARTVPLV